MIVFWIRAILFARMKKEAPIFSLYLLFMLTISLNACNRTSSHSQIQAGDLLFQDLNCGPLCDAIEAVTNGVNGRDFSHCAMVISINDSLKVIEAIGQQVQISSLEDFFKRSGDSLELKNISVARLRPKYQDLIPKASAYALANLGKAYDQEFLIDNEQWYCSELLYESFKVANANKEFFSLTPMTFKDPQSQEFFPAWVDYYRNLNRAIPEGEPGLNPGSISRSEKIEILDLQELAIKH